MVGGPDAIPTAEHSRSYPINPSTHQARAHARAPRGVRTAPVRPLVDVVRRVPRHRGVRGREPYRAQPCDRHGPTPGLAGQVVAAAALGAHAAAPRARTVRMGHGEVPVAAVPGERRALLELLGHAVGRPLRHRRPDLHRAPTQAVQAGRWIGDHNCAPGARNQPQPLTPHNRPLQRSSATTLGSSTWPSPCHCGELEGTRPMGAAAAPPCVAPVRIVCSVLTPPPPPPPLEPSPHFRPQHFENMQAGWGVFGWNVTGSYLLDGVTLLSVAGMGYRCDFCNGTFELRSSAIRKAGGESTAAREES